MAVRRQLPQVMSLNEPSLSSSGKKQYESSSMGERDEVLAYQLRGLRVSEWDFRRALLSCSASKFRTLPCLARPLSPFMFPLLSSAVQKAASLLLGRAECPEEGGAESAGDPLAEPASSQLFHSPSASGRLLLHGAGGCGQELVLAALLALPELEGLPIHRIDFPSAAGDAESLTTEESVVRKFYALRQGVAAASATTASYDNTLGCVGASAVLVIPLLDRWWAVASPLLRQTLMSCLFELPSPSVAANVKGAVFFNRTWSVFSFSFASFHFCCFVAPFSHVFCLVFFSSLYT